MRLSISLSLLCLFSQSQGITTAFAPVSAPPGHSRIKDISTTSLQLQQPSTTSSAKDRFQLSDLQAFASDVFGEQTCSNSNSNSSRASNSVSTGIPDASLLEQFVLPVLSAALLITGNTVGAGMLVLPELAEHTGMGIATGVMVGAYLMNWMSGLTIAQVAIQQHESSGDDVPSSFKEFAQANLFESAATMVSGISIFVNSLVLAFDTTKAGQVGAGLVDSLDGSSMSYIWAALMFGVVSTQSLGKLSQVASMLVMGLFVSFAGLLLPGLAEVSNPLAVLTSAPPTGVDIDIVESVLHMAPVFVTTLVYQNIVPTVTRMLDYDRTKVVSAITLGSVLPLGIYLAWCVAVLGGGIVTSTAAGPLLTVFSLVTVAGSSMGALMSLSEEFQIVLGTTEKKTDTFSWLSVAIPTAMALGACQLFAGDINEALQVAGSYGSPLLYGLIPVAMAYLQQQRLQQQAPPPNIATMQDERSPNMVVPGGMAGLGVLGLGATGLIGSELLVATIGPLI